MLPQLQRRREMLFSRMFLENDVKLSFVTPNFVLKCSIKCPKHFTLPFSLLCQTLKPHKIVCCLSPPAAALFKIQNKTSILSFTLKFNILGSLAQNMKLISQEQQLNNFISKQTFCTVVHNNNIYRNNYESKVLHYSTKY